MGRERAAPAPSLAPTHEEHGFVYTPHAGACQPYAYGFFGVLYSATFCIGFQMVS